MNENAKTPQNSPQLNFSDFSKNSGGTKSDKTAQYRLNNDSNLNIDFNEPQIQKKREINSNPDFDLSTNNSCNLNNDEDKTERWESYHTSFLLGK